MTYSVLTRDQHFQRTGPKRILALDGGGLRGMITLGALRRIEALLRERHGGDPNFRLCHYFDLVAGTSTGAIIAAALATGMGVEELIGHYQRLGREVFRSNWLREGILRARYDEAALVTHLKQVFGDRTLGDPSIQTGLLIVTKRLDTGSPWPLGNNPKGQYFRAGDTDRWISNGDYPLWKVVRASTAAPSYFDPEPIQIASGTDRQEVVGSFVDGGVSPFNNPSLQAFMYATLDGYNVRWRTGADQLLLVSIGTGMSDPSQTPSRLAAQGAIKALFSLMDDCGGLVETMMQWMAVSPTRRRLDSEVGDLNKDVLGGAPLLSYLRYNVKLTSDEIDILHPGLGPAELQTLAEMDNPGNLGLLLTLGEALASQRIVADHFPAAFDLVPEREATGGRLKYVKRPQQTVVAVQLALETSGFSYEKWGATQTCKPGDWIVSNEGETYTVDQASFARTYRPVSPGVYLKATPVWAEVATAAGTVPTKEGETRYEAGDYLVFNEEQGGDGYAVPADAFNAMYEPAP